MAKEGTGQHFKAPAAVMLLLFREHKGRRQVLLQHRHNVAVLNDLWDTAVTGHVERGESLREALAREALEELGIVIRPEDLRFSSLGHILVRPGFTYYNIYFEALQVQGEPFIAEPGKCDAIGWFDVEALPEDIIPERAQAIRDHFTGRGYHEAGF